MTQMIVRKSIYILCSSLLIVLLLSSTGFAATYYVRADGTKGSKGTTACNSGSASDFMDVSDLNGETLAAGDKVIFCNDGGTYNDLPIITTNSGNSGNEIIYEAESGDGAVNFDEYAEYSQTASHHTFKIAHDYIIFDGKDVGVVSDGYRGFALDGDPDYITIKNWEIEGFFKSAIGPLAGATPDNITIGGADGDGNVIHNGADDDTGGGDIIFGVGKNILISWNTIYGSVANSEGTDGIVFTNGSPTQWSEANIIEYNKIYDHDRENEIDLKHTDYAIVRYNDLSGTKGDSTKSGILNIQDSENIRIYGNYIHDDNCTSGSKGECNGITINDSEYKAGRIDQVDNVYIWGNIIANISQFGITVASPQGKTYDVFIYNNVFYNMVDDHISMVTNGTDSEIRNNIFMEVAPGKFAAQYYSADVATIGNNLYYDAGSNVNNSSDGGTTSSQQSENDPLFNNPANHDFSLKESSPAIDAGATLNPDYDDILTTASLVSDWVNTVAVDDQ
ncbi:MAG: DUF5123 domain-containing protein, partial [Candidatus Thorarchaeota archaeon]